MVEHISGDADKASAASAEVETAIASGTERARELEAKLSKQLAQLESLGAISISVTAPGGTGTTHGGLRQLSRILDADEAGKFTTETVESRRKR